MTKRFLIVIFLTSLYFCSYSQVIGDTIYVGTVSGQSKSDFIKRKSSLAKTIGITDITESRNKIEIRLYETYFLAGLTYCTTLYLDTTFKVNRTKYWRYYDSKKYQPKEINTIDVIVPSKVFSVLITNGIFSLPNKKWNETLSESKPKELTQNGLTDVNFLVIADGVGYTIEFKVDSIFNRISFSNADTYFKAYPDNQLFRRQYEIIKALGAGFK